MCVNPSLMSWELLLRLQVLTLSLAALASTEQSRQAARAVAKAVFMDAELIQHGKVEVGHRGFEVVAKVTAGLEGAAGFAGEEDGEVFVVVAVAVADSGAVKNHAVVQKAAISFGDGFEALQDVGDLAGVELVDVADFSLFCGIVLVVGERVMAFVDADEAVAFVASFVGEHEGGDARGVGLEGKDHHVSHKADVFFVRVRSAFGFVPFGKGVDVPLLAVPFGSFQPEFDFADGVKVFIQFGAVFVADFAAQSFGVFEEEVEDAVLKSFPSEGAFGFFGGVVVAKKPLEEQSGVGFFGHGSGGVAPGDVVGVGAGVAGVAFS